MCHFSLPSFVLLVLAVFPSALVAQQNSVVRGTVVQQQLEAGSFFVYVPKNRVRPTNVLVICHGTIGPRETALTTARIFINRWLKFSEQTGVILVAPAFDVANYASGENAPGGTAWGYRALDGRIFSSDQFVDAIVEKIKIIDTNYDGKFYLYGHSAGAQFANHYLMVHPERLNGVVLSAPAIYAMPDPNAVWPNGLKARTRILQWGNQTKKFEISHQPETIIAAVQLPIAVVVGTRDTEFMSEKPQQGGSNRLVRGQHYVQQMQRFAAANGVASNIGFVAVKGIGHDSAGLTVTARKALMVMGQKNAAKANSPRAAEPNRDKKKQADGDE